MKLRGCFTGALALALLALPAAAQDHWVASWGTGSVPILPKPTDKLPADGLTYRNIARMSLGGSKVRLTFTNRYGAEPLLIDHASVALRPGSEDGVAAASLQQVTFSKAATVTIAPGTTVISDPVNITFKRNTDLAVSLHVPQQQITTITSHPLSHEKNYVGSGDQVNSASMKDPQRYQPWDYLAAIDVMAPKDAFAIVAVGDSITDGAGEGDTPGTNNRWPNYLSERLEKAGKNNIAVVNEGIGSNRVLTDGNQNPHSGATPSVVHRWKYDALERAGVKYIILMEGVNDIGASDMPRGPKITADQLIGAYKDLIDQAHKAGVKVIMGTMTPFKGAGYWKPEGEGIHDAANAWIRGGTANGFDGFIDFAAVTEEPNPRPSPESPDTWQSKFNNTDHLHPNVAGKVAMANAIDLSMFK